MISNPYWNGTPKGLISRFRVGRGLRLDKDKVLTTTQPEQPYTTLTGDVTGTGSGSAPTTISEDAVDNTKLADMDGWTIKLRNDAAAGDPQDAALADLTEEAAPAAGDFLLGFLASGELRTFDVGNMPGGGGGGGASWIPMVDGSEPPNFITDGAGNLILVAYP